MRLIRSAYLAAVIGLLGLGAGHAQTDGGDLERVVARNVQDMLPGDGHGGVAVALRVEGRRRRPPLVGVFCTNLPTRAVNRPRRARTQIDAITGGIGRGKPALPRQKMVTKG